MSDLDGRNSRLPRAKRTSTSLNRSRSNSRSSKKNLVEPPKPSTANQSTSTPNTRTFEKILYENDSLETNFFVLMDYTPEAKDSNAKKRINELKLYTILKKHDLHHGFKVVKRIGFRRCKVQFDAAAHANKVINSEKLLKKENLKAFIPINFVIKYGIIKEIPKDFTEEELLSDLQSEITIKSVKRFTRVDRDNNELRLPTNTIKVGFLGNSLPIKVTLHSIPLKVEYFIPKPKQCLKCGRLGHLDKVCKNTKLPCLKCGLIPKCTEECAPESQKCLLCNSNEHLCISSTPFNCWKKNEQLEMNRVMAIGNLSFNEVKSQFNFKNSFALLRDEEYEIEFPESVSRNNKPVVRSNTEDINSSLRRHATFSNVTKKKVNASIPEPKSFPRGEDLNGESQCVFNTQFVKTSEAEKLMSSIFKSFQENSELYKSDELNQKIKAAKAAIQTLLLCNDQVIINKNANNHGQSTSTQHTKS